MKKAITILIRRQDRKNRISVIIPKGVKTYSVQEETEVTDDLEIYTRAKIEVLDERKKTNDKQRKV